MHFRLLLMYQHGLVDYLARRHMPKPVRKPPPIGSKKRKFNLLDLSGAFILLACGLCLTIAVFIGEILFYRFRLRVIDRVIFL